MFSILVAGTAVSPIVANVAGYLTGLVKSYFLNRNWTFWDARTFGRCQLVWFASVNIAALGLRTFVAWTLTPGLGPPPAKLVSVAISFAFNYRLTRTLVFQPA
jgi:putative flippase GtrA